MLRRARSFAPSGCVCRPIYSSGMQFSSSAPVEAGGTIRADGHNLDLYGMQLGAQPICAPEGARWACGQRVGDCHARAA